MRDHGWKETGASVRGAASVRSGKQNDSFVEFVRDQLAELGEVRHSAMFGGFGLYCSNTFFGIVYDERLYFKTDERSAEAYVARGMGLSSQTIGRSYATTTKSHLRSLTTATSCCCGLAKH